MGEISEALERARQEEARRREERRKRRSSDVSDSLRQAAVDSAVGEATGVEVGDPVTLATPLELRRAESGPDPAVHEGELHPTTPSILSSSTDRIEQCRHLANRIAGELERRDIRTLALVSALRMEGKSTVSSNLALATATLSQGRSVALVDLDLRRPTIASKLDLHVRVGVEAVLQGRAQLEEARIEVEHPALDIYAALPAEVPAHELLVLPSFARFVRSLAERYRVVFFDTPPVLLVPDANLILKHVEACATVARAGISRARAVSQMIELLPPEKVIGCVLNATASPRHVGDYYADYSSDVQPQEAS